MKQIYFVTSVEETKQIVLILETADEVNVPSLIKIKTLHNQFKKSSNIFERVFLNDFSYILARFESKQATTLPT